MRHIEPTQRRYLRKRVAYLGAAWIFSCAFLWQALSIPPPSRPTPVAADTFPTLIAIAMVIAATGMLGQSVWTAAKASTARQAPEPEISEPETEPPGATDSGPHGEQRITSRHQLMVALATTTAYVSLFFPLGYLLSTFLFLGGLGSYFWRRSIAPPLIALAVTIGINWLFSFLGITLPPGPFALPF